MDRRLISGILKFVTPIMDGIYISGFIPHVFSLIIFGNSTGHILGLGQLTNKDLPEKTSLTVIIIVTMAKQVFLEEDGRLSVGLSKNYSL